MRFTPTMLMLEVKTADISLTPELNNAEVLINILIAILHNIELADFEKKKHIQNGEMPFKVYLG